MYIWLYIYTHTHIYVHVVYVRCDARTTHRERERERERDESPIGDGSTTEELEGEEEEQVSGKEPQPKQAGSSESWHKNTRPAEPPEPPMPKRRKLTGEEAQLRLDQIAYLTMWMQQSTERRQVWEREYPDQGKDVISLAKEIQYMDVQLGDGATMQCIYSQLMEWGIPGKVEKGLQEQTPETPQCKE